MLHTVMYGLIAVELLLGVPFALWIASKDWRQDVDELKKRGMLMSWEQRFDCRHCNTSADIRMAGQASYCPLCGLPGNSSTTIQESVLRMNRQNSQDPHDLEVEK